MFIAYTHARPPAGKDKNRYLFPHNIDSSIHLRTHARTHCRTVFFVREKGKAYGSDPQPVAVYSIIILDGGLTPVVNRTTACHATAVQGKRSCINHGSVNHTVYGVYSSEGYRYSSYFLRSGYKIGSATVGMQPSKCGYSSIAPVIWKVGCRFSYLAPGCSEPVKLAGISLDNERSGREGSAFNAVTPFS